MTDKPVFPDVHHRLQGASVALAEGFTDIASELASGVLRAHAGQPQAMHVVAHALAPRPVDRNLIDRSIGGAFFLQRMKVKSADDRIEIIAPLVRGRRVLHVGCVDYPIFDPANNLHVDLAPLAAELDGLDTDREGLRHLERHVKGRYFASADEVRQAGARYDVLLVPETIEHVRDACAFLRDLHTLTFDRWMVTAPCVYGAFQHPTVSIRSGEEAIGPYASIMQDDSLIEEVHPDHKYWFTPYTLANLLQSSVPWTIEEAWLMHQRRQVGLLGHR